MERMVSGAKIGTELSSLTVAVDSAQQAALSTYWGMEQGVNTSPCLVVLEGGDMLVYGAGRGTRHYGQFVGVVKPSVRRPAPMRDDGGVVRRGEPDRSQYPLTLPDGWLADHGQYDALRSIVAEAVAGGYEGLRLPLFHWLAEPLRGSWWLHEAEIHVLLDLLRRSLRRSLEREYFDAGRATPDRWSVTTQEIAERVAVLPGATG